MDKASLRKINLITCKDRPFCAFCNAVTGFTWYTKKEVDQYSLCYTCYTKSNFPSDCQPTDFEAHTLPDLQWERISKELTPELESLAKAKPQSQLTPDQQQQLLKLVAELGDDWKTIADTLGLKNKKEAVLEFLRVPLDDGNRLHHKYLVDLAYQESPIENKLMH